VSVNQVSISSTFDEQFYDTQVFCTAFLFLQIGFVFFWRNKISTEAVYEMLMKFTTGDYLSLHKMTFLIRLQQCFSTF